jgi:hypothetical protein
VGHVAIFIVFYVCFEYLWVQFDFIDDLGRYFAEILDD